jgi:hypothetical protein
MKKAKKKTKKKATRRKRTLALRMEPGGQLKKLPVPRKAKKRLWSYYVFKGGAVVEIEGFPADPYVAGHQVYKVMEALANVYADLGGMSFADALGEIVGSVVDHAEEELKRILAAQTFTEQTIAEMVRDRQAAVVAPDLGGRKKVH